VLAELGELERDLAAVRVRAPAVVGEHRRKLLQRVNEVLAERAVAVEDKDVVREVALLADRVDVAEEVQRLNAHIARARVEIERGGTIGRTLEFLSQEMLREVNTIGSKTPDVEVAHRVVAMKSAIEKLREQTANLE
jgi:uncharacterized protein (TIGR00255 family)